MAQAEALVLDSVSSPITKRVYNLGLYEFFRWFAQEPRNGFTKATVSAWRVSPEARGSARSRSTCGLRRCASWRSRPPTTGCFRPNLPSGSRVKGVAAKGVRLGNWLTVKRAQTLLNRRVPAPQKAFAIARSWRCSLAAAASLRSPALTFAHVQQRDGRWCVVDLAGKHGRARTIPAPTWTKVAIDA
jgi:hypothetical protein